MQKIAIIVLITIISMALNAQSKKNEPVAKKAFDAWSLGEKTGNYDSFKPMISTDFKKFSHPLLGSFVNEQAINSIKGLIAERELKSNSLDFKDVELISNKTQYVFLFKSSGIVSGGYPYNGFNAIVLTVEKEQMVGFTEYFGLIDPDWFKNEK